VLLVVSDTRIAVRTARKVSVNGAGAPSEPARPAADERGQAGRREQRAEGDAGTEEDDRAPVDVDRLLPVEREAAQPPVHRQHEQQARRDDGHDALDSRSRMVA
jgi:hypothetical protein